MTNRSKAKGTRAETAAVRECHAWGLAARRNDLGQGHGDIEMDKVVIQVKDNVGAYSHISPPRSWLGQAETQGQAADKPAVLLVKPSGIGALRVRDWHAWMRLADLAPVQFSPADDVADDPVRLQFATILTILGGTPPGAT